MRKWQEFENKTHYYYNDEDGLIIGQIHKFGNSMMVYTASVKPDNVDQILGQFISGDFAKKSVEKYWDIQDRTLLE
jgi:hypothetical protein